jgi:hypothetical protein
VTAVWHALSIRQPWAALLVSGRKTVEIRTWPTRRRGRILIHAGKVPDRRPAAWEMVADDPVLQAAAAITGGVVGVGELIDCVTYAAAEAFAADQDRHHNKPEWFRPPRVYGLVFANMRPVPLHPCAGSTFFFGVDGFVEGATRTVVSTAAVAHPTKGFEPP